MDYVNRRLIGLKAMYFDKILPFITSKLKKHFFYKGIFLNQQAKMAMSLRDHSLWTLHNNLIPKIASKMVCRGCDVDACSSKHHTCLQMDFGFGASYPKHFLMAARQVVDDEKLTHLLQADEINNVINNCYPEAVNVWQRATGHRQ